MESTKEELLTSLDTEGQMFQPVDYGTSRHLANSRTADIERELRNRSNQKASKAQKEYPKGR